LKYNEETKKYEYGEIDWQEFISVIKGNGECNHHRMQARNKAHDDGAWVRAAAAAYAEKQNKNKVA